MNFSVLCVLVIILVCSQKSDCKFQFSLQNRENDVFKNVSMWTLNSKGVEHLGEFGNYLICEDIKLMATFAHIRKCFNNCSDESSYHKSYHTGIFGTGSKQFSLNLKEKQCNSKTALEGFESYLPVVVRHIMKSFLTHIDIFKLPKLRRRRSISTKKWSQLVLKLLIVVDPALHRKLPEDFEYVAQYLNIFWSAVDLKYRQITNPKISIKVIGVIIVEEKNILKYIDDCRNDLLDENSLDLNASLDDSENLKKYLGNVTLPNYDAVITMSGLQGYIDDDDAYGIAFNKGLCDSDRNGAIIIDDGNYFGVNNAVHELGHLLGLSHDGDDEIIDDEHTYFNCTDQAGKHYIMHGRNNLSEDQLLWSNCSLQYFSLLESDEAVGCAGTAH